MGVVRIDHSDRSNHGGSIHARCRSVGVIFHTHDITLHHGPFFHHVSFYLVTTYNYGLSLSCYWFSSTEYWHHYAWGMHGMISKEWDSLWGYGHVLFYQDTNHHRQWSFCYTGDI